VQPAEPRPIVATKAMMMFWILMKALHRSLTTTANGGGD
jgi:hypothetical protein